MDTASYAFNNLSRKTDIFLVQEHWYFDCQLSKLNSICQDFNSCGKAVDTGNPILPIQMPRGYGGVAILWRKDIDHLVTTLSDGSNRIQCIEISCKDPLILVAAYMPCKGLRDNVDDFVDCISQLQEIYQKYSATHTVIFGGDFNEDLQVEKHSERKQQLETFLRQCQLTTKYTEKTYVNPDGVEKSTIDYIFYPKALDQRVQELTRLDEEDANESPTPPMYCQGQPGPS